MNELALLDELCAADKRTAELFVDASHLDHDVVHPLAQSQRIGEEIRGATSDTGNLLHQGDDIGSGHIEIGRSWMNCGSAVDQRR